MSGTRLYNALSVVLLVALIWGCSPKMYHGVLSFFFDGVPEYKQHSDTTLSDSLKRIANPDKSLLTAKIIQKQFFYHAPYQAKECTSCHNKDSMGKLVEALPKLCYQCHEDFSTTFKLVHEPVASGDCLTCHNPHLSENEKLTIRKGQQLCLECHDAGDIAAGAGHKDIGETKCTSCHNPHGGNEKGFLITAQTK
jgi:predicted CXXCH cytochrome family protein